jgi:hypothetical protein
LIQSLEYQVQGVGTGEHTEIWVHTPVYTYVHTYIHTYVHTYIHKYVRT